MVRQEEEGWAKPRGERAPAAGAQAQAGAQGHHQGAEARQRRAGQAPAGHSHGQVSHALAPYFNPYFYLFPPFF